MDQLEIHGERGYLFEYSATSNSNLYRRERIFKLTYLFPFFKFFTNFPSVSLTNDDTDLNNILLEVQERYDLDKQLLLNKILSILFTVIVWTRIYSFIFKKVNPKLSFGLCYYNNEMLGMNLAASRMGVKSIDMQHGAQGELHPMYTYNRKLLSDFEMLPDIYWVWDKVSGKNIENWISPNKKVIYGGNPWIDFLKEKSILINIDKPVILITVQPLNPVLEKDILEVIYKSSDRYEWWIRYHPRMTLSEKNDFETELKEFNILKKVNFDIPNELELPQLLEIASVHISRYSGSISEASMVGVPSIICDEIGLEIYKDLELNQSIFNGCLENSDEVLSLIETVISFGKNVKKETNTEKDYKVILDEITS
ncbi:hypothetical protein OO013_15040 [Mangrovivirga sp. M17]|uniref:Uncharacterized protein n=1 Tax=Mangrovivirga halotolerans TaxID=2993936 RepID=A0ABT3RV15_9BACT|nr:hypothetical protein [Mangrovivirga halotolerans]MCX2745194.1 hypothetical protein [Mangrovivirga halotolerans]